MARLLPHPVLSLALAGVWLLLNNSLAAGQVALGIVFGIALPLFTSVFWPGHPIVRRPLALLRLIPLVLFDIVVANLVVARLILSPWRRLRSRFIEIPLEITNEFAITMLAGIITLTPGTVSADLSLDRKTLLVHGLDVADAEEAVAHIKTRYERPLKEIFG